LEKNSKTLLAYKSRPLNIGQKVKNKNHTIENGILNANSIFHITSYNKSNNSIQIMNQKGKLFWLSSIDISLSFL